MRNLPLLSFVCLLLTVRAFAQQPVSNRFDTPDTTGCFAGTVWFNTVGIDTIYLCLGDSIFVPHNGDQVLQDLNPATPPGIAYALYQCQPTGNGTVEAFLADSCLWPGSVGTGFFTTFGHPDGNIWIYNTGYITNSLIFCGGSPCPITFVPITINDYDDMELEPGCVDVNINAAFTVVFLREIRRSNFHIDPDDPCSGQFRLRGGKAEWDTSINYSVTIRLVGDTSVQAVIHTPPGDMKNGATVSFTVPQPGTYLVAAAEPNGCADFFEIDMIFCKPTSSANDHQSLKSLPVVLAPNPVQSGQPAVLTVEMARATDATVWVFDPTGKVVYEQNNHLPFGKTRLNVPTATLHAGAYSVLLRCDAGTFASRLVVLE